MTLAAVGLMQWPKQQIAANIATSGFSAGAITFDSTTDRLAYVTQAYQADSISKVLFRTGTVTTGCTVQIRIESVSNGRPSGTIIAAGASGTVTVADSDDNVWKTVTIGTPYTFSVGEEYAIVMTYSSGTTPNMGLANTSPDYGGWFATQYPQRLQDTGAGSWAVPAQNRPWEWVVEFTNAGGAVTLPGLSPLNGDGTITAFNSGSAANERALKFVPPFKCRVVGLSLALFNMAAGADFTAAIWDATDNPGAGPTPLAQTNTIDGDTFVSTTADGIGHVFFTAPVTLTAGTTYYAGLKPSTANNIGLLELSAAGTGASSTGIRAFGIGANTAHLATRAWVSTDPGAWTNTTTTLPGITLLIDQLDDGASAGGGLLTHPGMAGGMRG